MPTDSQDTRPDNPPAFPVPPAIIAKNGDMSFASLGMTLRDYFAAQVQADDRLAKCVRAMDDVALEIFALYPHAEREEHITEVDLTCWAALPSEVQKVARRLELEARALARVRYMQADAMLIERAK